MAAVVPTQVIIDASPLIGLARVGRLHILADVFAQVVTTRTVWREVTAIDGFADIRAIRSARAQAWVDVLPDPKAIDLPSQVALDAGERTCMHLAMKLHASGVGCLLIVDDAQARTVASQLGLRITGTVGVLLLAKKRGFIPVVAPVLVQLRQAGYFLSNAVVATALAKAKESIA